MIRTLSLFLFTAIVSLATAPAMAQENSWGTHAGQVEINFTSSYESWVYEDSNKEYSRTFIDLMAGYFLTDNIEVGGSLRYKSDSYEISDASPYVFMSLNHNVGGNITPFVGFGMGSGSFEDEGLDSTIERTFYGPFIGAKFFVGEGAALTLQGTYDLATYDIQNDYTWGDYEGVHFDLSLGLSVFLNSPATTTTVTREGSWGTHKGQVELNFTGSLGSWTVDFNGDGDSDTVEEKDEVLEYTYVKLMAGYFVTDGIEVGASLTIDDSVGFFPGPYVFADETSLLSPYIFVSYNHNTKGSVTPYAGVGVGSSSFTGGAYDINEDRIFYGPFVGAKFFVSRWAAITLQGTYNLATIDYPPYDDSYSATHFDLSLGLSAFLN